MFYLVFCLRQRGTVSVAGGVRLELKCVRGTEIAILLVPFCCIPCRAGRPKRIMRCVFVRPSAEGPYRQLSTPMCKHRFLAAVWIPTCWRGLKRRAEAFENLQFNYRTAINAEGVRATIFSYLSRSPLSTAWQTGRPRCTCCGATSEQSAIDYALKP